MGRAQDGSRLSHGGGTARPSYTKVGDFHSALVIHDDVLRFDIPVNHVFAMGETKCLEDLSRHSYDVIPAQRRVLLDYVFEGVALEVLHRDVERTLRLASIINLHDIGVVEAGGGARFAPEPLNELRIPGILAQQHLKRDVTPQMTVMRQIDLGHAAHAQAADDLVSVLEDTAYH